MSSEYIVRAIVREDLLLLIGEAGVSYVHED